MLLHLSQSWEFCIWLLWRRLSTTLLDATRILWVWKSLHSKESYVPKPTLETYLLSRQPTPKSYWYQIALGGIFGILTFDSCLPSCFLLSTRWLACFLASVGLYQKERWCCMIQVFLEMCKELKATVSSFLFPQGSFSKVVSQKLQELYGHRGCISKSRSFH